MYKDKIIDLYGKDKVGMRFFCYFSGKCLLETQDLTTIQIGMSRLKEYAADALPGLSLGPVARLLAGEKELRPAMSSRSES